VGKKAGGLRLRNAWNGAKQWASGGRRRMGHREEDGGDHGASGGGWGGSWGIGRRMGGIMGHREEAGVQRGG
jgi:hypothetical protein